MIMILFVDLIVRKLSVAWINAGSFRVDVLYHILSKHHFDFNRNIWIITSTVSLTSGIFGQLVADCFCNPAGQRLFRKSPIRNKIRSLLSAIVVLVLVLVVYLSAEGEKHLNGKINY